MNSPPLFWLSAFVLAVGVLVALVWPLLRQRRSEAPEDEAAATAVFRDHKRQLDADFAAGTLSADERDVAQAELATRFGNELAVVPADVAKPSDRSRWIAAVMLVAVLPAAAGLLYAFLGNPAAVNVATAPALPAGHAKGEITDAQVAAMIDRLAEKLRANPEDANGWVLLGRTYLKLGRYNDSAAAFAEAAKRMPEDAGLLTNQAEAIAMAQGRRLAGRPTELLKRALQLDPDDGKAIALSAAAATERNDFDGAILLYKRLKALVPPNGEDSQQIDQLLADLEAARKGTPAPAVVAAPAASAAIAAPSVAVPSGAAPSAAPPASVAAPASTAATGIAGRVEIDPRFAAKMAPGDTLFIYARNSEGSRMPLAILRGTAAELPKSFALTDAMAMTPSQTISGAKSVIVEARISKAGNAMAQPGDLRGTSAPLRPGAANVRIVIDQVVP